MSFTYGFQGGEQFIANLGSVTTRVQKALEEVEQEANRTLATWDGSAKAAYYSIQQQWHQTAQSMPVSLQFAQQKMGDIHAGIHNAERVNTASWQDTLG